MLPCRAPGLCRLRMNSYVERQRGAQPSSVNLKIMCIAICASLFIGRSALAQLDRSEQTFRYENGARLIGYGDHVARCFHCVREIEVGDRGNAGSNAIEERA